MTLLLDTHTFLWFVLDDAQLSTLAKTLIEDPTNDVLVSPASYWEIAIKVGLGKLDLRSAYDDFMRRGIVGNDFVILAIEPRHTSVLTNTAAASQGSLRPTPGGASHDREPRHRQL
jgi:PIN domain nuclease of toxin-antitoxin system